MPAVYSTPTSGSTRRNWKPGMALGVTHPLERRGDRSDTCSHGAYPSSMPTACVTQRLRRNSIRLSFARLL
jgi:hypothetical protein